MHISSAVFGVAMGGSGGTGTVKTRTYALGTASAGDLQFIRLGLDPNTPFSTSGSGPGERHVEVRAAILAMKPLNKRGETS